MDVKVILFDLDGTLLPMDQDLFIKAYFGLLAKKLSKHGYEPDKLIKSIWTGTISMVNNNGLKTNEEVFWDKFKEIYGEEVIDDESLFADFYENEFQEVQKVCGYNEQSNQLIKLLKEKGYKLVLATNPIFPFIATKSRIKWAGLDINDFEHVTTYENSRYCKPNLKYYQEILNTLNLNPEDCIMIGNDVNEDMVVNELGIKSFLLTDCLINKDNKNISVYPNGNINDLIKYIEK